MDVGRKVLGPHPGLAIVKFWQGVVEIILRVITLLACVAAVIGAAIALQKLNSDLPSNFARSSEISNAVEAATSNPSLNSRSMLFNSQIAGGLAIPMAVLILALEIAMIVIRFLNIGLYNLKVKIFLSIDIIVSFLLSLGLNGAGVLAAFIAKQWDNVAQSDSVALINVPSVDIRNVMIGNAVTALLAGLSVSLLFVWLIAFLIKNWNRKVIKETVKSSVF